MRRKSIYSGTDITHFDIYKYSEKISLEIKETSLSGIEQVDFMTPETYQELKNFFSHLEFNLASFGYCTVFNKRLHIKKLEYLLEETKKEYSGKSGRLALECIETNFNVYYLQLKQKLIEIEYYELIPSLDRKYKTLQKTINKSINK